MGEVKVVTLEQVYELAKTYAPSVMKTFNLPSNKFSAEDIVGEFIVNFMEKDFLSKFDGKVTSMRHYVYLGVRNIAVSMYRHIKKETTSIDQNSTEEGAQTIVQSVEPNVAMGEFMLEDILSIAGDIAFGYGTVANVKGILLESKSSSVIKLLYQGYSKQEIAQIFGVTGSTVFNVLEKVKYAMTDAGFVLADVI